MEIKVLLNRTIGATKKRENHPNPYTMIVPIKKKDGTFKAPANIDNYFAGFAFKKYLLQGEIILVNEVGGWNILTKNDHILKMWQE